MSRPFGVQTGIRAAASVSVAYEDDYFAWTQDQAAKLRAGSMTGLDWANTAEEIESLGDSHRDEIESRLTVLLTHLLKWAFQPGSRSNSWRATIVEQRGRLARRIKRSPSLKGYPAEVLAEEYGYARLRASGETGLPENIFPEQCPFSIEDVLDQSFLPEIE